MARTISIEKKVDGSFAFHIDDGEGEPREIPFPADKAQGIASQFAGMVKPGAAPSRVTIDI